MIIPYMTVWERTAGRASSKAPNWQEVRVAMRARKGTIRTRAYLPPMAVLDDFGGVKLDAIEIMGIMVAEDVRALQQDDTLETLGDKRTWWVENPQYYGGGLVRCVLREGSVARSPGSRPAEKKSLAYSRLRGSGES